MLKEICVLLTLVVLVHCHMTGLCVSRVSDGRLQVAVEHWHGAAGIRAGASYTVSQGGLSVSNPWQAPLACGCPPAGCGTSYHSCSTASQTCNGSGVWYAIVNDPGFTYPGNIVVTASGGGSVTDRCGSCTGNGVSTSATIALPPPASTCFADICGDGIISGAEVCEVASPCPTGYPSSFCGSCCLTGTPCCNTGTALCQSANINLDLNGQGTVSVADVDNGSTLSPDCPQAGYPRLSRTALTCADYPSTTVNLLVGPAGGSETCTATVTVNDVTPPTISCPSSTTINNDAGQCGATFSYSTPVGTDSCPGAVTTRTAGPASGSFINTGSVTITHTVQDQAGLTASCSFTVTVVDAENPRIDGTQSSTPCPSPISVNNDAGLCGATVTYATPIGTDNCPGATTALTGGIGSGNFFPVGLTTPAFEVTDATGRTASCSFGVTVTDAEAPVISCPASFSVNSDTGVCGATVTYATPAGTDNCAGATTSLTAGQASGSLFPLGATTQTYRVTDAVGRTASCSFTVTVIDSEVAAISCPAPISVSSDAGICGATVTYTTPVGTDNCPGVTTTLIAGLASGSTFPIGVTTQTYRVTDAAGATASCSFTVTVADNESPTIDGSNGSTACPSPITVNTDSNVCSAVVSYTTPIGTDQCPGATNAQTSGISNGGTFPVGTTINEYTVTDASGNTAQCFMAVTVVDNQDPNIDGTLGSTACPADMTVNSDPNSCGAIVTYTDPVGSDSCAGVSTALTAGLASGSFFGIGPTTQTFTATDANGNTASCSFTVIVVDAGLPTIDGTNGSSPCPSTISTNTEPDVCSASVSYSAPVGTDQCPGATTAQTAGGVSGSTFAHGTTANTFVVTDASGNTAQCSFNVVVVDGQLPQIDGSQGSTTCPASITVNNDPGSCDAVVTYVAPVGTDNCPGASTALTTGLGSGGAFPAPGPTTETYVVTDADGRTASCSFTVTVNDIEDPVMDGSNGSTPCPAAMNVNTDAGVCSAVVTYTTPAGADACGATTTQSTGVASGGTFPLGTTTNTFDATDSAGNTVSCSFTVTVADNEDPVIDGSLGSTPCPAPIAVNNDPGQCGAMVTYTPAVGADGCSGATTALTGGLGSGSFFPVGTTTEAYTVTDAVGRTASCSFTVTVIDNEPPTLNSSDGFTPCMAPFVVGNDAGLCSAVVNYPVPVGVDNCGPLTPTLVSGLGTGGTFPAEATTSETYTVSDASGNSVTCSFDVVVEDREAPVITHSPAGVVEAFPGEPYSYTITMTDNCATDTHTHVSGPMPGDSSMTPTDPQEVVYTGVDAAGNTVQYQFHVQTILIADGVPSPTYMYLPMTLDVAGAAFPSDTHITYQLRPVGGGQAAFESARAVLTSRVDFEGASQVLPGRWEFWMVGWPSTTARYSQEFILCASEHFCY